MVSLIRFEHYVVGEWWVGGSRVLVLSLRLELNNYYQYYIIKQFNVIWYFADACIPLLVGKFDDSWSKALYFHIYVTQATSISQFWEGGGEIQSWLPPPSQPTYIFSLRVERESDLAVTQSSDFISDHVNCCVLSRCGHWHLTPWRILKHINHISLGPNKGAHRHAEIPDSAPNNKSWVSMFGIIVLTAILKWQDFQNSNFCVHI